MARYSKQAALLRSHLMCARCGDVFEGTKSQAIHNLYDKRPVYCSSRCRKKPVTVKPPCIKCGAIERYPSGDCRPCALKRRLDNRDRLNAAYKVWRSNNLATAKRCADNWRKANLDRIKRIAAEWKRANPKKRRMHEAKRRAAKTGATPRWANKFFIEEVYDLAVKRSSATGFDWHVDHIVPLQSELVCGLHCEQNLQVIPAMANIAKRNRYWPDMP